MFCNKINFIFLRMIKLINIPDDQCQYLFLLSPLLSLSFSSIRKNLCDNFFFPMVSYDYHFENPRIYCICI